METFMLSKDGRWYYGGYITVDPEEHSILKQISQEHKIPERVVAGILLRQALRKIMTFEDYANIYKERMKNYKEYKEEDNGKSGS